MIVCIAEKPSVAKEIAEIVGAKQRKQGYYEGNGYQVTYTYGHLCTLMEPEDYDVRYKKWDLNTLPIIPEKYNIKLIDNEGIKKQFNIIKNLVENADYVVNCGDAGQEGELIQRWILKKLNYTKPHKRLWISSLTEEAIKEGFKNLKSDNELLSLYKAGEARAISDWILGINATRAYTVVYGKEKQVLSIGRVQTPTLAMIVKRHFEIQNFVSKKYFELKTKYREVIFNSEKGRYDNKEDLDRLLENISEHPFVITDIKKKKGLESAPRLFDLTSLQVECNKHYGLSADVTLNTVQRLYEMKLTTYPRVDTCFLPEDIYPKISGILNNLTKLSIYSNYIKPLLGKKLSKSKKVFDNSKVTDHHAIIPTGIITNKLTDTEAKVYDKIVRRFIAVFYPECSFMQTIVKGEVNKIKFKATGKQIIDEGWKLLYKKEIDINENKKEDEDDFQIFPEFVEGESGEHSPFIMERQTQPPKPYTEATLLRAMETAGKDIEDEELRDALKDNGIGRPSTRANIIETLLKRNYIIKQKKNLIPTPLGIEIINLISNELLKSAELTGYWEKKLRMIERNEYDDKLFIEETKSLSYELIRELKLECGIKKIRCPKCINGYVIRGKSAYGCSDWNNGCDFRVPINIKNTSIKWIDLVNILNNIPKIIVFDNKKFYMRLNEEKKLVFILSPKEETCPLCGSRVIMGKNAYGCSSWKTGCGYREEFNFINEI